MTAPNVAQLINSTDPLALEIGRLTALLASIEDPGPYHVSGEWQQRWDGGARITGVFNPYDAAAQGYPWPVLVANKDYIADPVERDRVAAGLQQQIAALQTQRAATLTQIQSLAGSDGVIRVGNVSGSTEQVFLPAPPPPVQGPVPSSVTAQLQAGLPLEALTSSAPPVSVNLPPADLAGSGRSLGSEPLVSIQEDFGAGGGRATVAPVSDDDKQALLGAALVAVLAYLLLSGD